MAASCGIISSLRFCLILGTILIYSSSPSSSSIAITTSTTTITTITNADGQMCEEESILLGSGEEIVKDTITIPDTGCVWQVSTQEQFGLNITFALDIDNNNSFTSFTGIFPHKNLLSIFIYDRNPLNGTNSQPIHEIDIKYIDSTKSLWTNRSKIWIKIIHSLEDVNEMSLTIIYRSFDVNRCLVPVNISIGDENTRYFSPGSILNVTCHNKDTDPSHSDKSLIACSKNEDGIAAWNGSLSDCSLDTPAYSNNNNDNNRNNDDNNSNSNDNNDTFAYTPSVQLSSIQTETTTSILTNNPPATTSQSSSSIPPSPPSQPAQQPWLTSTTITTTVTTTTHTIESISTIVPIDVLKNKNSPSSSSLNCFESFTDFSANISSDIYQSNISVCNVTIDVSEATSLQVTFYANDLISFVKISGQFFEETLNLTTKDIPRILELRTNKVSILYHIRNDQRKNITSLLFSYLSKNELAECDWLNPPKHGFMSITDNSPGSEVSFFCPPYHTLVGDNRTRCEVTKDGTSQWSHPTPYCVCGGTLNVTEIWVMSTSEIDTLPIIGGMNCSWEIRNDNELPYQVSIEFNVKDKSSMGLVIEDVNKTCVFPSDNSTDQCKRNFTTVSHIVNVQLHVGDTFQVGSESLVLTFTVFDTQRSSSLPATKTTPTMDNNKTNDIATNYSTTTTLPTDTNLTKPTVSLPQSVITTIIDTTTTTTNTTPSSDDTFSTSTTSTNATTIHIVTNTTNLYNTTIRYHNDNTTSYNASSNTTTNTRLPNLSTPNSQKPVTPGTPRNPVIDKRPGRIDVYAVNVTNTKHASLNGNDVGKIAVGIAIPVLILLAIGIGVYIWYRKKYPVRMILGKEFQNFTNPLYVKSTNTVEININSQSPPSLVVKEPKPQDVPGEDNLAYDDEADGCKSTDFSENSQDPKEKEMGSSEDSSDLIKSTTEVSDIKSMEVINMDNNNDNIDSIQNDDESDIEVVSKESSSLPESAQISISEDLVHIPQIVSKDHNFDSDNVLVSISDEDDDGIEVTDVISSNQNVDTDDKLA
ncbi:hypothetical protein Ahia01_000867100 [Argonauta hians]